MKLLILSAFSCIIFASVYSPPGDPLKPERPVDPWVFYTGLDTQESVLAVGMDKKLWVAYDTSLCSVYKLWSGLGVVKRAEKKYPVAEGVPFIYNEKKQTFWKVWQGGKPVKITSKFKKHEIINDRLWMSYDLILPDGNKISMKESPEFIPRKKDVGNRFLYERIFQVDSIPAATEIFLMIDCESMIYGGDIKTTGKFTNETKSKYHFDWGSTYDFTGELKLNTDKETVLRIIYTLNPEQEASGK